MDIVRRGVFVATCGAVLLALSGCSESAYPIFDRPAEESDELPAVLDEIIPQDSTGYDLSSVRLAAEHEGHNLYLLKDASGGLCLAIANGGNSFVSCSGAGGGGLGAFAIGAGSFEVAPAPIAERDGWTILSENIRVKND